MTRTYFAASAIVSGMLLVASSVSAQDAQPGSQATTATKSGATVPSSLQLTLADAVRRAVENNPDLAIVRLDTDAGAARVSAAQSAFQPLFSSSAGRSSNVAPPSIFLQGVSGIDTTDLFASAGVRQRLSHGGGTWMASWDAARTGTNSPLSSYDPSLLSGLQVAFSQPLLRDRKMDSAREQYIITKRNHSSSELRFRESTVQTVAAVKQAYWTLKAAIANVNVQQRSLDLAQDLVRENRARVNVGQTPPIDLVQAEAEVASRHESLIRAETTARDAEDRLRQLIMDPGDSSFWQVQLDPVDQPDGGTPPPDLEATVTKALAERYDLARARHDLENADTNVQFLSNQKLPDVRLEASYRSGGAGGGLLVRNGPFPGVVTSTLNTGFGNVLGQVFGRDFSTWSVGVTVNYPIGPSYESASLARADVERRQAAQRIASLQLQAAESIREAARAVKSTAERIESARAGQTLAEQRLDVEKRRFEAGLSTTFLVTQAQRDLLQTQVNLLQAMLDHQSSLVNLEALQLAPAAGASEAIGVRGAEVVAMPPAAPAGIFRTGSGQQ
jgi:outer membrane protein